MTKKFKLLKSFPGSPDVGTLYVQHGHWFTIPGMFGIAKSYRLEEIESSPEFFTPFVGTSTDGKDVYLNDVVYPLYANDTKVKYGFYAGMDTFTIIPNRKLFSSKESAQNWIEEMNKPKYEVGEWVYFNDTYSYGIFRFKSIVDNVHSTDEGYQIGINPYWVEEYIQSERYVKDKHCTKATTSQIQDILSKVAIHKGFKEGVKFIPSKIDNPFNCNWNGSVIDKFIYSPDEDSLGTEKGMGRIYQKSKWAEILPQEEIIPEYVKLVGNKGSGNIGTMNGNSFYDIVGTIYNTKKDDCIFGLCTDWKECLLPEFYQKNFVEATQAEYALQQYKLQLQKALEVYDSQYLIYHTVDTQGTLDIEFTGKVTDVSINDRKVKINYQVK